MPPRISPQNSRGGGVAGRGARGGRGGPPTRAYGQGSGSGASQSLSSRTGAYPPTSISKALSAVAPSASAHITTVGVKRASYGVAGTSCTLYTNHFEVQIPDRTITHYDVITPSEKTLPAKLNMDIIVRLQKVVAPTIFTSGGAVYDGRKNLFSAQPLRIAEEGHEFDVTLTDPPTTPGAKGPKIYKVKLKKVAQINLEVLQRFLQGVQSHDNDVLTAINALNVVVRMEPQQLYPFNTRSFFTDKEKKDIGLGLELWRGYFQSVRPAIGKMLINVDISTGTMYKAGPLLNLCLEFIGKPGQPQFLMPSRGFPERERLRLQRFIAGIRVRTAHTDESGRQSRTPRVVKKLCSSGAADLSFALGEGGTMTVADYFRRILNKALRFPDLPCVEVGSGALLPLELCDVPPGQIMRKQVPPELTKNVLEFATKKPADRLDSIRRGLNVLSYGQSDYVSGFGLKVEANVDALKVAARILPAPTLRYGQGSRNPSVTPANGSWNMVDKKFYRPAEIKGWIIMIYERQQRFRQENCDDMKNGLMKAFADCGISCPDKNPLVKYENGQGNIATQLRSAGNLYREKRGIHPTLIVAILPEGGTDMYTAIKHFGDCVAGVATQCMKSNKCFRAKQQYYANVCLKVNVKLGGINNIPDPLSPAMQFVTDNANPTIVMGADVIHPAPGSDGRPSFTGVVANVDSASAKYIAQTRVQVSRKEMIDDLQDMCERLIEMYRKYRRNVERKAVINPKRIIFYRDGVSEGQFQQVLDIEVPRIRNACQKLGINPPPKITVVVVGKRHHVRFFPTSPENSDNTGNCRAGTVVDRDVGHPTEFDFYLQSHGGLLGTSRPAHYNVLLDENNFNPDGLQELSFALCHVYARSTRSVSIPAPVYYADIVCSRAKNHFDPDAGLNLSETNTQLDDQQADASLESFKKSFKDIHPNTVVNMYFS